MSKIFEYAVVHVPDAKEVKDGKKPEIIVKPTVILAKDDREALFNVTRAIPAEYADRFDQLEIAIRPF